MKIAIDANELCLDKIYGVKVYTYNVIKELMSFDKVNEYILYSRGEFLDPELDSLLARNTNFQHKIIPWNPPFWTYTRFPAELWKDKPDVLFMPIQTVPFLEHNLKEKKRKDKLSGNLIKYVLKPHWLRIVTVIHDVAFIKFPKYFKFWDRLALINNTKRALHLSDIVITPSEATKMDIRENYKTSRDNIRVVNNGYDTQLFFARGETRSDRQIITERFTLDKPYFIFIGVIQPRKNISSLIKAFRELLLKEKQDIQLVIVGNSGWMSANIYKEIQGCGFYNRIRLVENVNNRDLAILLRGAEALVLPSLYEGFGLPVVEAMACGTPVIISNVSSLPEMGGEAAVYIDPLNYHTITEAALKILKEKSWKELLKQKCLEQSKKFSWAKTAQGIHQELTKIAPESSKLLNFPV